MKKQYRKTCFYCLLILVPFLLACSGKPVPEEKRDYIGVWKGPNVTLEIYSQGRVHYRKIHGGGSTKISAPIKEFIGNDFVTGVLFFKTRFRVSRPPYREGGRLKMVVDGIKLTKLE